MVAKWLRRIPHNVHGPVPAADIRCTSYPSLPLSPCFQSLSTITFPKKVKSKKQQKKKNTYPFHTVLTICHNADVYRRQYVFVSHSCCLLVIVLIT